MLAIRLPLVIPGPEADNLNCAGTVASGTNAVLPVYPGTHSQLRRQEQSEAMSRSLLNAIELSYCIAAPKKLSSIVIHRKAHPTQSQPSLSEEE